MKLIEAFNEHGKRGDFDVITDGCWVAYCGTELTDEGLEHYAKILQLECEFVPSLTYPAHLAVHVSTEEQSELLEEMLLDMAVYCSQDWYNKHFK